MNKTRKVRETKPGWELNHDLFEIHWKRGPKELYADKVRIQGCLFYAVVHGDVPVRPKRRGGRTK